jgi:tetratricopeptide (TPR) repeat protein
LRWFKRSIDSLQNAVDGIYVAVTYKDKPTSPDSPLLKLLKQYNANVFLFQWVYDFAAARQFVMDKTPKGENCYIYWQDADDVLVNSEKLHQIADEAYQGRWAAVAFEYQYMVDLDKDGNIRDILVRQKRERIIRNDDGFKWTSALHETLIEQRHENVLKYGRPECYVVHLTNHTRLDKNLDRNIDILEKMLAKEQRKDPRTIIYLAKAYYDKANMQDTREKRQVLLDEAVVLFYEFLNGAGKPGTPEYRPGSGWPDERSQAWDYIGQIAILSNNLEIAIHAFQSAIDEAPQYTMYYINLALAYAIGQDYRKAKHWLRVASSIPEPDTTIMTTPRDLKTKTLEVDYAISLAEGRLDQAKKDVELLLQIMPEKEEVKDRLKFIESLWYANKASQSFVFIGKYLEQIKETDKIPQLIKAVPRDLQGEKFVSEMRHLHTPARVHGEKEISILCGPGWEQWSPKSLEKGLGGSEEAVVYLSQELAKKGWKVTVYANPQHEAGEYDGVDYRTWFDLNVKDTFNVLVLWRSIWLR